jgi:DNA (cytosine-5)-methyltransferase 1
MSRDRRPVLLDLFCGAGGATKGYQKAGFYVIGADINSQPNYCGDDFIHCDALGCFPRLFRSIRPAAIAASPPCQAYSSTRVLNSNRHPELIEPCREALAGSGLPYVIENVPGAPLVHPVLLCGTMFPGTLLRCQDGIFRQLRRHRLFETNWTIENPGECTHTVPSLAVFGDGGPRTAVSRQSYSGPVRENRAAMGIDWTTRREA